MVPAAIPTWPTPLALSAGPNGGRLVHRVERHFAWRRSEPSLLMQCAGHILAAHAEPRQEPLPGDLICRRCDVFGIQQAPSVVYMAKVEDTIKVGCTIRLVGRMADFKGCLITHVPGERAEERSLIRTLAAVAPPVRGSEWFPDTPEVAAAASDWFAAHAPIGEVA